MSVPDEYLPVTGVRVVKAVNSPSVRLQLDLFHLQMISGNVTNNIRELLPITGMYDTIQYSWWFFVVIVVNCL